MSKIISYKGGKKLPRSKLKELIDEISNENISKSKKEEDMVIAKSIKKTRTTKTTRASKSSNTTKKTSKSSTSKEKSKIKKSPKSTKKITKKSTKFVNIAEYYDLPYRYNQTVVKVLAQNPNTLFIYWDISDADIENFKKTYGDNFFNITKPVLVIHNVTDNYSFEVNINDFANNWYVHVDNTKCKYSVELGRRPNQSETIRNGINSKVTDFINISFSNTIEMPNDHILFLKTNDKIYFKNIKTNKITEKIFNEEKHSSNFKALYKDYELPENGNRFDFQNPSSQTPTSNVM